MTSNLSSSSSSKNDEGIQNFASLSRNALYAPLTTYIKSTEEEEENKNKNGGAGQNVPKSIREKTLYSFLENISVEYHSSTSFLGKRGGNNGGIPLKSRHMENKTAQRALTLIGGGYGTSFAKSTSEMISPHGNATDAAPRSLPTKKRRSKKAIHFIHGSVSNKKRKKAIRQQKQSLVKSNHGAKVDAKVNNVTVEYTKDILVNLNGMWNKYINTLLLQKRYSFSELGQSSKRQGIASLISTAEIVGAYVIIESKATSYTGRVGVVVDVTKNTWRVASPLVKSNEEVRTNIHAIKYDAKWKTLLVPKQNSSLMCVFHLPPDDKRVEHGPDDKRVEHGGNRCKYVRISI
jgi:RNase P/RNase MRP subunit p29